MCIRDRAFDEARAAWLALGQAGAALRSQGATALSGATAAGESSAVRVRGRGRLDDGARPSGHAAGRRLFLGGMVTVAGSAAAVSLVYPPLGLWPDVSGWRADYRTATGEKRHLSLDGGLDVTLNTQSSLNVAAASAGMGDTAVLELLAGEAVIETSAALLLRLGSVHARLAEGCVQARIEGDDISLTCVSGHLEVMSRAGPADPLRLQPQQRLQADAQGHRPVELLDGSAMDQAAAWMRGEVLFRDTPLSQAAAEINRYRRGRLVILGDQLGRRTVTGRYRIDRLDDAIALIQKGFSARARHLPGGVVLLS